MAAIGVALWRYVMRYAPHTPTYFNRDRFVLSNGKEWAHFSTGKSLTYSRTHMSLPIHFSPSYRLQSHDIRSTQVVSF